MTLAVVILAAGKGTRMRSALPKVLHPLGAKPLLQHVIDSARLLSPQELVVVVGHGADLVKETIRGDDLHWVIQDTQLGTGHAVKIAMPEVTADNILILYGDVPLITEETLNTVVKGVKPGAMNLLTVLLENPKGYGRIVRSVDGQVSRIVEEKDADAEIRKINEGNSGILCAARSDLEFSLQQLKNNNAQGEYYLTDCIELSIAHGGVVNTCQAPHVMEVTGVNDKLQLNELERYFQELNARALLEGGVTLADKSRIDVRGNLTTGMDVYIDINCVFIGNVSLGDGCRIGPNCTITQSMIGNNTEIFANSVIDNAIVGDQCSVGPFARLRPQAILKNRAKVGNFVEIKKSEIGEGSKVSHLSYIGDATLGKDVNIGAGTITCNYDGANKHHTKIGDTAFIGSNTALVAPVDVSGGATIGAGSTISKDAPQGKLTLSRARQITIETWQRPKKGEK